MDVYPDHHHLFCPKQLDLRHRLYTTIVGILLDDKPTQGKRPPMRSLTAKLWINSDLSPTITPMHHQAMLLTVPPATIRRTSGFPAASEHAIELVEQAIQQYRYDAKGQHDGPL